MDKSIEQKIKEIKDTIAKEHGFNDWEHAISEHVTVSEETINEVARRYGKACQQNLEVSERLTLDLSDQQQYYVRLEHSHKRVFKSDKFGQESKYECLYWIYMNGDCYSKDPKSK